VDAGGTALAPSVDVGAYEIQVALDSIEEIDANQKRYRRASYFIYTFFGVGLLVGLLPKIFG
jgi:hypothetical protein